MFQNHYTPDVNVNNWMEERHDINYIKRHRQQLTDFDHAYKTEYMSRYGDHMKGKLIPNTNAQEKRNEEKVIGDFISIMDSLIKEFSARFSQFKELSETFKFIMYPDVISFDKLNLSQFDWLEIEELEMQLIDF
ncbi:general transcription factor II-I repeat domain-containing protein 2A [Trichonephila clavipes]|nr:general transcription factor II-I repeat domain-containing protein 2A [Trichonephila clavipes]